METTGLQYSLMDSEEKPYCRVQLIGEMSLDGAKNMLTELWVNPAYLNCPCALYDLCEVDSLPNIYDLQALARFVVKHKAGRGPVAIAFVSGDFAGRSIRNIFAGFARLVGLKLSFFAENEAALRWLEQELAAE